MFSSAERNRNLERSVEIVSKEAFVLLTAKLSSTEKALKASVGQVAVSGSGGFLDTIQGS